ncbi:protein roadkill-like [Schistocerca serialis cubense]|uniref:protein roadkill-like n=1 Tax=Schistocerca serialis cubense TaxID=2023355 RepID=UPI00214F168F|nr:protein roadkill-like [Schistocerca serialis cubense]
MEAVKDVTETVDLGALLDAGDDAMVTLEAGDTRLVAHRAVLADRSPVFAAMFAHDTLETSTGAVSIPDVGGPVLRQLVSYLYTLQAPQLPGTAPQLLAAADKYGVSRLKAECERQVAAQLTVETAAAAAVLAVRHSCSDPKHAALAFIKTCPFEVMATQGWADAMRKQPEDLIEVSRLLYDPPPKSSAPVVTELSTTTRTTTTSGAAAAANSASAPRQTPAAARPTTPPPDEATVSRMRRDEMVAHDCPSDPPTPPSVENCSGGGRNRHSVKARVNANRKKSKKKGSNANRDGGLQSDSQEVSGMEWHEMK